MNVAHPISRIFRLLTSRQVLSRAAFASIGLCIAMCLLVGGLLVRQWAWENTESIRFRGDITNSFDWGSEIINIARQSQKTPGQKIPWTNFYDAYRGFYERIANGTQSDQYQLDYPPLRLLVMSIWVKHLAETHPKLNALRPSAPELAEPLLHFNSCLEVFGSIGLFLLVRYWLGQCEAPRRTHKPWILGLTAAALFWFDPAMLVDGHTWPQWDGWIAPFFIWAMYLALIDWWFVAGLMLALGAMLKGQVLAGAPVLLLFAIFRFHIGAVARLVYGFVVGVAALTSPWLVYGNFDWYHIGFAYGTYHHMRMHLGVTYNLAALLEQMWGWNPRDPFVFMGREMEIRRFMISLYGVSLVLSSIGAAAAFVRRRRELLVALVSPWVLFFALSAQMHERYLVWFAALSCVFVINGPGMTLLHVLATLIACCQMLHTMLSRDPGYWPDLYQFIQGLNPGLAYGVLLLAGICLYQSLTAICVPPWPVWLTRAHWARPKIAVALRVNPAGDAPPVNSIPVASRET